MSIFECGERTCQSRVVIESNDSETITLSNSIEIMAICFHETATHLIEVIRI